MFLLLPISVLIFYFQQEKNDRAHFLVVIFSGILTGAIILAYKMMFSSVYFLPMKNFGWNFAYYFITQSLLPVAVIFVIFSVITKKDTFQARCSYFFPLLASFYSIYLPYLITETDKPYAAFYLFVKPVLFLSMLIFVHIWLSKKSVLKTTLAKDIVNYAALVIAMCLPAIAESAWICGWNFLLWLLPSLFSAAVSGILIFPKSRLD